MRNIKRGKLNYFLILLLNKINLYANLVELFYSKEIKNYDQPAIRHSQPIHSKWKNHTVTASWTKLHYDRDRDSADHRWWFSTPCPISHYSCNAVQVQTDPRGRRTRGRSIGCKPFAHQRLAALPPFIRPIISRKLNTISSHWFVSSFNRQLACATGTLVRVSASSLTVATKLEVRVVPQSDLYASLIFSTEYLCRSFDRYFRDGSCSSRFSSRVVPRIADETDEILRFREHETASSRLLLDAVFVSILSTE